MSRSVIVPALRDWPENISATKDGYPIEGIGVLPRVTSIIDKTVGLWSHFLNNWYAKTEREAVLLAVQQQFDWAQGMTGEAFAAQVEKGLSGARAAQRKMEAAGDIGTEIHKMIQWRLRAEMGQSAGPEPVLSPEAWLGFTAWCEWWEKSGIKPPAGSNNVLIADNVVALTDGTTSWVGQDFTVSGGGIEAGVFHAVIVVLQRTVQVSTGRVPLATLADANRLKRLLHSLTLLTQWLVPVQHFIFVNSGVHAHEGAVWAAGVHPLFRPEQSHLDHTGRGHIRHAGQGQDF